MKHIITLLAGLTIAAAAYATCSTHTITRTDGRLVTCTTCCTFGSCHTTCF